MQLQSLFNAIVVLCLKDATMSPPCVCVFIMRALCRLGARALLGQQVAVEDEEQGHGCAVEEQEIEGQQRR